MLSGPPYVWVQIAGDALAKGGRALLGYGENIAEGRPDLCNSDGTDDDRGRLYAFDGNVKFVALSENVGTLRNEEHGMLRGRPRRGWI